MTSQLEGDLVTANAALEKLKGDKANLANEIANSQAKVDGLGKSYKKLEASSASELAKNTAKNRALLQQLEDKEKALAETAALLVLRKKLKAFYGEEPEDD